MWTWTKQNKPNFSVSAVNPAVVLGPPVLLPSPKKLNETLLPLWRVFSGEAKTIPPGIGAQCYIHVNDVAALHIWCMEHPAKSNGQRYLAANGIGTTQAMADILRREYPKRDIVVGIQQAIMSQATKPFRGRDRMCQQRRTRLLWWKITVSSSLKKLFYTLLGFLNSDGRRVFGIADIEHLLFVLVFCLNDIPIMGRHLLLH